MDLVHVRSQNLTCIIHMSTMAQLVRSICSNQATALTKTGALYFISVKTEQQRVGEYLNLNFAGYLNFKRDEPELELHIQKSKTLKGKIAKTTGLPSPLLLLLGWWRSRRMESHVEYQLLMRVSSENDTGPKTKPEQTERITNRKESVEPYKLHSL